VLKRLRARGSSLPVLILTAADSVEQRVTGLDSGADDYMAKPFSLQELEARVRAAHAARPGHGLSRIIRHGPLSFDAAGRVAYLDDQMLELSAREISLLEVLLQRCRAPGQQGPARGAAVRVGRGGLAPTPSRSTSTACARRSSMARCASPPCAAWATASRRSRRWR
jgi:CheY-like chemotaxis protein